MAEEIINPEQLIEWYESYGIGCKSGLICRMTCGDAINYQKSRDIVLEWELKKGTIYTNQMALDDFMLVRWAHFVEGSIDG